MMDFSEDLIRHENDPAVWGEAERRAMTTETEHRLRERAKRALRERQGLRSPKTHDLFTRRCLIGPE
ncbi:MAG: hypothetical protein H5U03_05620, partial [Clostridia bacterium]|nr:hypothetical protein [Clostridia bacterium]